MLRGVLEPKSNRESFIEDIQLYANKVLLDPTGCTAQVQLENVESSYIRPDYVPYYNYGTFPPNALLATTENGGISIVNRSAIRFTFTKTQMQTLPCGQFRLSAQVTSADGTTTRQLFQLQIPILDGGVPMT